MQTAEPVRVQVIFRPDQIAQIEELRRNLPDLPTRAETIRRLCQQALTQRGFAKEAQP